LEVPTRTISLLILEGAYITHNNNGVNIQENCSLHIQKAFCTVKKLLEVPTRTISLLILEGAYITHNNNGVNIQENCSLHIQKALLFLN
jgi:carbonic anhydrase/acetyltransferase-like protein (isoleucine patch superfamily)